MPTSTQTGAIYYVDQSNTLASDSNSGTEAKPWLTITKAANTLVAGDTVYIKSGVYKEYVIPKNSGTSSEWITYSAYSGADVWIDGDTLPFSVRGGLIQIGDTSAGKSYIKVSGLKVRNAQGNSFACGILVIDSSYITLVNNYTYNTQSSGIAIMRGNNIVIDNNDVELAQVGPDREQECMSIEGTGTFQISDNRVFNSPGSSGRIGIDMKRGASNGSCYGNTVHDIGNSEGIYIDAWDTYTHDISVYGNTVYNNGGQGIEIGSERGAILENVYVYNNTVYNNSWNGISISSYIASGCTAQVMRNIQITNNTCYNNGSNWGGGIGIWRTNVEDIVVSGNTCANNNTFQIARDTRVPAAQLTISNNVITGYRGYSAPSSYIEEIPG